MFALPCSRFNEVRFEAMFVSAEVKPALPQLDVCYLRVGIPACNLLLLRGDYRLQIFLALLAIIAVGGRAACNLFCFIHRDFLDF